MKMYSLISISIAMLACSNTDTTITNQGTNNSELLASDLSGDWKFVRAELVENTPFLSKYNDPHPVVEEFTLDLPPYKGPDLHFDKDSMYTINYPVDIYAREKFSLDSGYLLTYIGKEAIHHFPIEMKKDTLHLYRWYNDNSYIKETYGKTDLNDSIMDILKSYGVNYPELAGTWSLVREESFNDGSYYTLKFPFKLPDSIRLTREELIKLTNNKMIYWMTTNGKKRDYILSYERGSLVLTPGKWYKGDDPWIHFDRE